MNSSAIHQCDHLHEQASECLIYQTVMKRIIRAPYTLNLKSEFLKNREFQKNELQTPRFTIDNFEKTGKLPQKAQSLQS